jgi:two-component system nitrogen regulation response regulator NtrX
LEKAHNGTLFIDNVNELSIESQTKILRVITDQRFKRLNDTVDISINFRVIASSPVNLKQIGFGGKFSRRSIP